MNFNITLQQLIEKAIEQPESYENDGEKIKNRSAADIIALIKFARKQRLHLKQAFRVIGHMASQITPGDELDRHLEDDGE